MRSPRTRRPVSRVALVWLLAASGLVGCATESDSATPREPAASAESTATTTTPAPPLPLLPLELTSRFSDSVNATMTSLSVPGAIASVQTPDGRWTRAFGTRRVATPEPVGVDDHTRIGSVTKTMIGTVVLQLVGEGRLALDTPIASLRPDVPGGESITVAMLLDMTSGLYSYTEDYAVAAAMDADPSRVWDPEELLRIAWDHTPNFSPGNGFRYSNTNTVLLGRIVEQVTGQPLAQVVRDRILIPLELTDTTIPVAGDSDIPQPHPQGYLYGTNVSAQQSVRLPAAQIDSVRLGQLLPNDVTGLDPSWIGAAGNAVSTVADLSTYIEALVDGDLLPPDLQQRRLASLTPTAEPFDTVDYGLAWQSFGPLIGHDGAIPGFQTFAGHDPVTHITVVVVCTVRDGPAGGRPANTIARAIADQLGLTR